MDGFISEKRVRNYLLIAIFTGIFFIIIISLSSLNIKAQPIIADHLAAADFEEIPDIYFDIVHDGKYLNSTPECNIVMMSWCGGCSDNTEEGINTYLNTYNQLELDYPDVTFVYMTGHLDGTGVNGNLYARNNQIRAYCNNNNKVLFDFADIESYDPDGNYYPNDTDYCNWCIEWCKTHDCPDCGCAHSQCFNCYLKGKAWWWMMARNSGWNGTGGEDNTPPTVSIKTPKEAFYFYNRKIIDLFFTLVIGNIEIKVEAFDTHSGVCNVSFYIDDIFVVDIVEPPFSWMWSDISFSWHTLKAIAYDGADNFAYDEIKVLKFL